MLRKKCNFRKPDPLMLITLLVSLSVFMTTAVDANETFFSNMTTAVDANETFFSNPNLPDFINGDITLTKIGHRGGGVHMFYKTPANALTETRPVSLNSSLNEAAPDVFLSLRVPW